MKNINKKQVFDIVYCICGLIVFLVVSLVEIFNIALPKWLLTELPLVDSSYVILQIQITIAILPLAIIALITGIMKDTLYGIPIMKYVMYLRPVVLTYRHLAISQIAISVISFFCMSYGWYNHLELCLFITISNTLIMMVDCFGLLANYQHYQAEIRAFLIKKPTHECFNALSSDIITSKGFISIVSLRDNISVLNEMLFEVSPQNPLFEGLNSEYINCFNSLFASKDSDIILAAIDMLQMEYQRYNASQRELDVFSTLRFEFYNGLKYVNLSDAHKRGLLSNLRFELSQNSAYCATNELTNFTAHIYEFGVVNNIYPLNSVSDKDCFVSGLYDSFSPFHEFTADERWDRLNFFKSLVDNHDKRILDVKVFDITDIRPDSDLTDKLYIIQYLYYIAACEPLADKEQILFAREYICSKQNIFRWLIKDCGISLVSEADIRLSYLLMRDWEITKRNCVKTLVFDSFSNDFWVFSSVAISKYYSLYETLGKIIQGNEFKLYSQYFEGHTAPERALQEYKGFCDLFGFAESDITLLKSFLSEIYKQHSIQEAKNEHDALLNNSEFKPSQINAAKASFEKMEKHFSNKPSKVKSQHIILCNEVEFCFELNRKDKKRLQDMINSQILATVCRIIMHNIRTTEIIMGEPIAPAIKKLKSGIGKSSINTMIGGSHCFAYSERKEEQELLKEYNAVFLSRNIQDVLFFISQSDFFLNVENITVSLQDLTPSEILSQKTPDENGLYSQTITNNLMGYFTKDEFVEFIQNRQVGLKIECDLAYGFSSNCVGYGIILKPQTEQSTLN